MRPHADSNALNLDTYSLSLITAKEDILNDRISTDWAVFTYERKWSLKLMDSGVGGLEELTKKLNKNLVLYGLCRVLDPNSQGPRFILIYWVGEHVDASRKEISVQHLPAIRRFFKEAPVMLRAHRVEDLSQEAVAQALSRVPQPARSFHRPRFPGSHEVVGTNYTKTNPAIEMKFSMRDSFWQRNEREEEKRKEQERLRLQEERITMEKARIERERLEEEERERRIQEKERMVEEQRREQARLEAEQRRIEKARWAQQQKEFEEEMKGRFRRSQSIEMAAEAAALISGRSLHPRDIFRQHERSVSCSNSPPSTPSSPVRSSPSFSNRTTFRYQRSMTESILTPPARSPSYFSGFQKRDSFSGPSSSTPPACSPAFIFSKAPLPGTSPKVDSLPSFIPPPISAKRGSPSHGKESVSPQSSISPAHSSGSSPQRSSVPPQGTTFPPQNTISPPQSSMPPPLQRSISPLQSTVPPSSPQRSIPPPPQRSIPPLQNTVPPQRSVSPFQSIQSPHLYDVPYRAEYVTLSPEESPQPSNTNSEKKAQTRPPALHIPPSSNFDTPDATSTHCDVYRAECVPIDSLNTSGNLVEQGHSPRSSHAPEEPAAIKATVSISTPTSEIAFASVTPVTDAKVSASPLSVEAPGLSSPLSAKAIGPTAHEVASPSALQTSLTSAAFNDQKTLTSPPFPISAGKPLEAKSNFYPVSSYESSAATKTATPEGLVPSPLPDSPITLEGKSSPLSSSLKSILQYVAPPPYTPFSARTDSVTVKAPAFVKSLSTSSRLTSSNSARNSTEISSTKAPSVETVTVNSINQPQVPPHVEPIRPHLSGKPLQSQTVAANGVQATSDSLATIGQPGTQPIENKENVSTVDSLPREDSSSTSQGELNKDKTEYLTPQAEVSCINLPEVKADPYQTEVPPADTFHLPQTEPVQPVSMNDLPEPQVEASVLPAEVLPSSASLHMDTQPDSQAKPSDDQTEVSPVESLPVEAPLVGILPESQGQPSEKHTEVTPEEPLPVMASLRTIIPDSEEELSESQTKFTPEEPLPEVVSLCTVIPDSQEKLSENQTEVTPEVPMSVVASLCSIIPDSQDELSKKQTGLTHEDNLSVVASLCSIVPESQEELKENQTEVTPEEPLPAVASLCSIVPDSQDNLSEKQSEVTPEEPLPVVASLCTVIPDSQEELNENQIKVTPEESLPAMASLCSIVPDSQDELSEKQTEVTHEDNLPVVASHCSIVPDSQDNLSEKQSEVTPEEPLPDFSSLPDITPESQAELIDFQTSPPIPPTLPDFPPTTDLLESQGEPTEGQAEIQPIETQPASASPFSAAYKIGDIGNQTGGLPVAIDVSSHSHTELPVEAIPVPEDLPTGGSTDSQLSNLGIDPPNIPLPTSVPLSDEMSPKSELDELQSEVPSAESVQESVPLLTDNLQKFEEQLRGDQGHMVESQASLVSFTLPEHQTEVSAEVAIPIMDFLSTDCPPESHTDLSSNQAEVPPIETSSTSTVLPPDSSSGDQADQMITLPADLISVAPAIPQISCNELQEEPSKIHTKVPPSEPTALPLDGSLDSHVQPNEEQIIAPVECSLVAALCTADVSCESSGEPINDQSETLCVPAFVPTDASSEPQADTTDGQPEILLSDIVLSLPDTSCIESTPQGQAEPKDDTTDFLPVQPSPEASILLPEPDRSQNEVAVPASVPVSLLESSVNQPENKAEENLADLPKPVEVMDIQVEFLPTEAETESSSFTNVISPDVQDEPTDRPSEVLPAENIPELALLPTTSQPELIAETNGHPSELSGLVSPCPDQIVESQEATLEATSEVLKPDTFIASMVLCTDELADFSTEENFSQPPTDGSPSQILSDFSATPSEMPPSDPTSVALIGDGSSTALTDLVYPCLSVDSSLVLTSLPTNHSLEFAADPNGNLLDIEFPPLCTDSSSEFLPPPPDPLCVDNPGLLEAPLYSDSLPATDVNLFEDPHPGSPPVSGSLIEPYHTEDTSRPETKTLASTENSSDKVIVHDILPINNLPLEENQSPKDLAQCNSDSVNLSDSSAFADHKHSPLLQTENALQTTENNIPENNNTVPSQVVL